MPDEPRAGDLLALNPLQDYLVHEFVHDYREGHLSRRDLVAKLAGIAGSAAAAAALLTAFGIGEEPAGAQEASPAAGAARAQPRSPLGVPEGDPSVATATITFPNGSATISAYQAAPAGVATPAGATATAAAGPPLVLVCHENRGLTAHIKDVARRYAKAGYVACAVDLLSREGGTDAQDPNKIPGLLTNVDPIRHVSDFQAAAAHYRGQTWLAADRLGMNGFCFGGGITWRVATLMPELTAAVPFYGPPPPLADVPKIKAAVFGVYSSDPGDFANNGRDQLEQALKAAGITYQFKIYPGTKHAFNNDTGPNYNEQQALAAWQDTLAWFAKYLRGA